MGGVYERRISEKPCSKTSLDLTSKDSEVNIEVQTLKLNKILIYICQGHVFMTLP